MTSRLRPGRASRNQNDDWHGWLATITAPPRTTGTLKDMLDGEPHDLPDLPPLRKGQPAAGCPDNCRAHQQHIYILCYGHPVNVRDRDYLRDDPTRGYPITHYVGWTSQLPPIERVRQHGAKSAHYVAEIRPGTMRDEAHAKRHEPCPKCGQSLWYYAESPTYSEEYIQNAARGQR